MSEYYNSILLFHKRVAIVKAYMQRHIITLTILSLLTGIIISLNSQTNVAAQTAGTPTPTTVPPNQQCGDICNPQYGATACSGGLNCSSSSILIDNLIPDSRHALGICATESLIYVNQACNQDILDGRPIGSCCQVVGDGPTIPNYYAQVSLNEVDAVPSTHNPPKVAAYTLNTNTKITDCVLDSTTADRKIYKCNGLVQGTNYTYKAIASGKNANTPTITSQINGRASTSTLYDLWITYANKAVISPAIPDPSQSIELKVSGKKLRNPEAKLTITGASQALGAINQEFELPKDTSTFTQTINIPPLPAGTYKVKFSVAEGYKATIPASVLTYDAFTFQVLEKAPNEPISPTITTTVSPGDTCPKKNMGDANCDNLIDEKDYQIWQNEYIRKLSTKNADFNGDRKVSVQDFEIWRQNTRHRDE